MKKSRGTRSLKKLRRNPVARGLADAKFRPRVVKAPGTYRRRPKHVVPTGEDE
jgi:hypothetical protein